MYYYASLFRHHLLSSSLLSTHTRRASSRFLFLLFFFVGTGHLFVFVSFLVTFFSGLIIFDVVLHSCLPTITRMPLILVEVEAPFMSRGSFLSPSSFPILSIGTHTQRLFYLVSWGGKPCHHGNATTPTFLTRIVMTALMIFLTKDWNSTVGVFLFFFFLVPFPLPLLAVYFSSLILWWFLASTGPRLSSRSLVECPCLPLSISLFPSTPATLRAEKLRFQLWSSIDFAGR